MRPQLNDFTSQVMAVAQWAKSNGFPEVARWMAAQELAQRTAKKTGRKRKLKGYRLTNGAKWEPEIERVAELAETKGE